MNSISCLTFLIPNTSQRAIGIEILFGQRVSIPGFDNCHVASIEALRSVGFPEYLLDETQARKMEDGLTNRLFNFASLVNVIDRNEDVFFALLLTRLLLESIMIPSLTAGQRITSIMSGISIVTIDLLCFDWAKCAVCIQQRETATGNTITTLWQGRWML
jgi:hypothetical protein